MIGTHIIFSAYGFWLPNDPRGSGSDFVRKFDLYRFSPARRNESLESIAATSHDRRFREAAKVQLRYPAVQFNGMQARAIGRGFNDYATRPSVTVWVCAILPEHVHMVLGPIAIDLDRAIGRFKAAATRQLLAESIHPFQAFQKPNQPPPSRWTRKGWKVFLDTEEDVLNAIRYVEDNPIKDDKPRQRWSFVMPFPQFRERLKKDSGESTRVTLGSCQRSPSESR